MAATAWPYRQPSSCPFFVDGGRYSQEVAVIVDFEVASQAALERCRRAEERLVSVQLVGARLRVHVERVEALAAASPNGGPHRG
jgi:hypothetical protein